MSEDGELIRLDDINFCYPGRAPLFTGLSLRVCEGDRLGLVGANGSGKTTLFRILVGLQRPQNGKISAFGRLVRTAADYAELRRRIGFLFQDSEDQLFCPTVREDVAFGPLNLGRSTEEVDQIVTQTLAELGLAELATRVSYELSGGEKRQVALATALAMQPAVLLLDEPATGLDPRSRRDVIERLARIGRTQVIASHDMEFVRATCQRVVVLDGGGIIGDGATDDVLGDDELMLRHGLEVPHSLVAEARAPTTDHHHGAGPSHGHGHRITHGQQQHEPT
ncbi:MAG: energy-coupling factor ABC transporter ATP-binding protein [Planctomycetes bacterium]|nr:energy-coupling factor ABC transporter ATP-binding protein [Planctomycetota bacterium]